MTAAKEDGGAKPSNSKYFLVLYCHDGTIHLWPGDTKADCLEKLADALENPKVSRLFDDATVIKRDMSNFPDGLIFGKRPDVLREAGKISNRRQQQRFGNDGKGSLKTVKKP